jgi:hypothetical protein
VHVKRSIDLSCLTPACSPEMKDMLRNASELPHAGQVSLTFARSVSGSLITAIGETSRCSKVLTSIVSMRIVFPHFVHWSPVFVARMYAPHFSQNFIILSLEVQRLEVYLTLCKALLLKNTGKVVGLYVAAGDHESHVLPCKLVLDFEGACRGGCS